MADASEYMVLNAMEGLTKSDHMAELIAPLDVWKAFHCACTAELCDVKTQEQ